MVEQLCWNGSCGTVMVEHLWCDSSGGTEMVKQ